MLGLNVPPGYKVSIGLLICFIIVYLYREAYGKKVFWFHRESCGYCKKMEPDWNKFANKMAFSLIIPIKIDTANEDNSEICKDFNIQSVPAIYKIERNIRYKYDGERTSGQIEKWVVRRE